MRIKNLFLLLMLVFCQGLSAKNPTEIFHLPRIIGTPEISCTLPPPNSLTVDNVGANWVQLSWAAVPGASKFRVQIIDGPSGDALNTTFIPGHITTGQFSTVGSSGACYARIWSVCLDDTWDPNAFSDSDNFDTIIIEVVGAGFTEPPIPTAICNVGLFDGCPFTWGMTETAFWVIFTRPGLPPERRLFALAVKDVPNGIDVVYVKKGSTDIGHLLYIEQLVPGQNDSFVIRYKATSSSPGVVIAKLSANHPVSAGGGPQPGYLYLMEEPMQGCVIEKIVAGEPYLPPSAEVEDNSQLDRGQGIENTRQLSVKPNPFRDNLTVQLPESNDPTGTTIRLYDLLGAVKRTCTATADQHERTLSTTDLTPGVYYLQVESGGNVETIKVVKTH